MTDWVQRCEAIDRETGQRCGDYKDHTPKDSHTLLIPTGAPWFPASQVQVTVRMHGQPHVEPTFACGRCGCVGEFYEAWHLCEDCVKSVYGHLFVQPIVNPERLTQMIAHRACLGTEHEPHNGKIHGYCVVCGVDWPCDYAGPVPVSYERCSYRDCDPFDSHQSVHALENTPMSGTSVEPTPYAVICPSCGKRYMTYDEYIRQLSMPNAFWICPTCGDTADWDDDNYEAHEYGV